MRNQLYVAGEWMNGKTQIPVFNPFNGEIISECQLADSTHVNLAIERAIAAQKAFSQLTSGEISSILRELVAKLEFHRAELTELIVRESAKPYRYAQGEVQRAIETFRAASEECKRSQHELIDLDWTLAGKGKLGQVIMKSAGIAAGIAPFNFPLNLVAHKVAPAFAARTPIILKPASSTPLTALFLADLIDQLEGLPKGALSVLPCSRDVGQLLVEDDRVQVLSFTGSPDVGWKMKRDAGKKKVVLELGGNAAAIVCQDASIEEAVSKLVTGAFAYSGQVCIHTQRIYVHKEIAESFIQLFCDRAAALNSQNPLLESCDFSVMIDEANAIRVENWVNEALDSGARCLVGGRRKGFLMEPTILQNTNPTMRVHAEEVFGPVVCINTFDTVEEAIAQVNDTRFGLQASVFTDSKRIVKRCFEELEVGSVIHNESTLFRVDHMPYGGIKDSGLGREGVRYAMLDYQEPRLLVE
jgi:acyl-CoA reductase-like NAD-dependent aldehyde dehydrogenase